MVLPEEFDLTHAVVYDIEADNLIDKVTKVHCICWAVVGSKTVNTAYSVDEFFNSLPELCTTLVGHNCLGFDVLVLDKFSERGIENLEISARYRSLRRCHHSRRNKGIMATQ